MLIRNAYNYIQIGLAIRLLRNVNSQCTKDFVIEAINSLTNNLETAGLTVTLSSMKSISYGQIIRDLEEIEDDNTKISEKLASSVRTQLQNIENVVFAESRIKMMYLFPERRFNGEYLLNSPQNLLKKGAFDKLDEISKYDISAAGKCLLIGEATATAFHILRATEAVLKLYYFHHRKQKRLKKPMWFDMLTQLKAKTKNKPPEPLLDKLDLIRKSYRNPTQHPEKIFEIDDVQDLFGVCLDVIGSMANELPVIEQS